jgi:uncharacterized protein YbjT (DUF2867 family)
MKAVLAGATGALGTILVPPLIAAGHSVLGLTRSPGGARRLREVGAQPVIADVMDSPGLLAALDGHQAEAVIAVLCLPG